MPRLPYTAIRALLKNARKVAGKPSASSRRKLLEQIREVEAQFQKVKPVEVPEGFPITRPTGLQARHAAAKSRGELYRRANLPESFVKDIEPGIHGLSGKMLTPAQLEEFRNIKLPPTGGHISLARLENLLAPRVKAMNPSYAPLGKKRMALRAGQRERIDYARKQALGDPTFDPTTGAPKVGGASMFKGAQELGQSLELREASARQTAALMRSFGDETRSIDELTKMILGSMEAGSRTGGLERTQAGQRMLQFVSTMRGRQRAGTGRPPALKADIAERITPGGGRITTQLRPAREMFDLEARIVKRGMAKQEQIGLLRRRAMDIAGRDYPQEQFPKTQWQSIYIRALKRQLGGETSQGLGPKEVSGALDALLGPLRDIGPAERGPRKEALTKLKQRVLDMMGKTYTGGAT